MNSKVYYSNLEQQQMPENWSMGHVFQHFKKGDKTECLNYRGNMLLNVAHNFPPTVLARKLSPFPVEISGEYQRGFCPGRSATEQVFILRQSLEKCYEYGIDVNTLFIDYKQAFDSIDQYEVQRSLKSYGILNNLINLIKMTLSETCSKVMVGNPATQSFHVGAVVRQGDALLATLFTLVLHTAIQYFQIWGTIVNQKTQLFGSADVVALMSYSTAVLKELFQALEREGQILGLQINEAETKYLKVSSS